MLERTFLFGLALAGVGTAHVESLRSWVLRLAFAHCVKPRKLFEMLLERFPLEGPNIDLSEVLKLWDVHGSGGVAAKLRSRFEQATGVDLGPATLTSFSSLLAEQHLLQRGTGRYCPECVKEDGAHGRLLWEVACVKACPVHRVRLRDASVCGAPKHEHLKLNARPRLVPVCSSCGSVAFACVADVPEAATEDEVWVATQVGRLLACGSETAAAWSSEHICLGLHKLVERCYGGSGVKESASAGLSRSSVCTWRAGVYRPSLGGLVQLCHHAQADVVALLGGRCESALARDAVDPLTLLNGRTETAGAPAAALEARHVDESRAPVDLLDRSYVRRACNLEDLSKALQAAIAESPPPNLTQFAERVETSARYINDKLPDLARALVKASTRYRKEVCDEKFDGAASAYADAARSLVASGKPVTPKYLQKVSGLVAFSQNPTRVRAMASAMQKFGSGS
jgi:hypothetical protein